MQQGFQTGEKAAIALVVAMACFSASASATSPVADSQRLVEIENSQSTKSGIAGLARLQASDDGPKSRTLTIAAGPTVTNPDPLFPTPAPYSAPPLTPPVSQIPVHVAPTPPTAQTAAPLPPVQSLQVPLVQAPQVPVAPAPRLPQVAPVPPTVGQAVLPAGASLDMQPLIHAKNAGVALCLGTLARASTVAIDAEHEAFSTWATSAPDIHIFQSIAIMRYSNQVAPRSASVLLVAPTISNSCEGGTVQVIPSARPCSAIQGQLMQGSKAIANLSGVSVIENSSGVRQMLLPAPGNGCVMISVGIITGAAPQ